MIKKWLVFTVSILVLIMTPDFCYAVACGFEELAGEVKIKLSAPPELGKVVTFTATFTSFYDADDCIVRFGSDKGIKILEEGTYFNFYQEYSFDFRKGKIKKGEPFSVSIKIKPIIPGVWNIGVAFDYRKAYDVPEGKRGLVYSSGEGLWIVTSEDKVGVYGSEFVPINEEGYGYSKPLVPQEDWYIASDMDIVVPEHKGEERYFERSGKRGFIAYLIKEHRIDFESTYQFKLSYILSPQAQNYINLRDPGLKDKIITPKSKPRWCVIGNIGTIDENGLFTATNFGKGKIRVEHGKWLSDEIDVEVIPHPNPSPPDKIVDVIVVPYDTEEERAHVEKVLREYREKRVKSIKDIKEKLGLNKYKEAKIRVLYDKYVVTNEITMVQCTKKRLKAISVRADGELVEKGGYDITVYNTEDLTTGRIIGKDEAFFEPRLPGLYKIRNLLMKVMPLDKIEIIPKGKIKVKKGDDLILRAVGYDREGNSGEIYSPTWEIIEKSKYNKDKIVDTVIKDAKFERFNKIKTKIKYTSPLITQIIDEKGCFNAQKTGIFVIILKVNYYENGELKTKHAETEIEVTP